MRGTFDLLQELADVVELKAGAQAEIPRWDAKRFRRRRLAARGQASTQELVDGFLEGTAGASPLRLELGENVVVEGQGGSHIMMLTACHHDVKPPRS